MVVECSYSGSVFMGKADWPHSCPVICCLEPRIGPSCLATVRVRILKSIVPCSGTCQGGPRLIHVWSPSCTRNTLASFFGPKRMTYKQVPGSRHPPAIIWGIGFLTLNRTLCWVKWFGSLADWNWSWVYRRVLAWFVNTVVARPRFTSN